MTNKKSTEYLYEQVEGLNDLEALISLNTLISVAEDLMTERDEQADEIERLKNIIDDAEEVLSGLNDEPNIPWQLKITYYLEETLKKLQERKI